MTLPPLSGIRAFEAAARKQNFRQAAAELGMTPAAVSQHVRALEDWLGVALFERSARGVKLTAAGQEFGTSVTSGLGEIETAVDRIKGRTKRTTVRLACLPSVVSHWLAPRLSEFRRAHPGISVSISYAANAQNPEEASADLLIQHGIMPQEDAHTILSAATRPTCAPDYLRRNGMPATEAALSGADLLHDETPLAWQRWFGEHVLPTPSFAGPIFADFNLLLSSVTAGLGVALCPTALIAPELAEGRLVVLFERASDLDRFYWLKARDDLGYEASLMRDWLIAQATPADTARSA
jgi:LysR family glycine cleavage system transcriptional activator